MSSANLELVRSIYTAWERGDFLWVEWAHPDIRYAHADGLSPGQWRGLDGMTEAFRDSINAVDGWGVIADGYRDLGGGRVLVSHRITGRGKSSGIDLAQLNTNGATLFEVSSGQVVEIIQYTDRDHAFTDLGLTPDTGT